MSTPPPQQVPYGAPPVDPAAAAPAVPTQPFEQSHQFQQGLPAGPFCRFCGSAPAVEATIRGHQGFLVIMKFLKLQGPFCRTCGIAAHRDMTAKSLWQGWWGIASMIINPVTMLINLPQRAKINKLAEPIPGAPGQPMNPGKPVFQRPVILGVLVPVIVVLAIGFSIKGDPGYAAVGDCVRNRNTTVAVGAEDNHPDVVVLDCSDPKAEAKIVGKVENTVDESVCDKFEDSDGLYTEQQGSNKFTLCLHFLK
ncbi:hypothetical protein KCMC57_up31500 [Kitasatospora sp. CMC57]|uniref:Toxin-antitoxin system, toxin component n=1 Tax=Kitasatospora sp. CMC57 TaxID=3231513 RepID=A0AB33JXN4_9ACTN